MLLLLYYRTVLLNMYDKRGKFKKVFFLLLRKTASLNVTI